MRSRGGNTESRFLQSVMAAGGSQIGRTALRLVADVTLARLILPDGHGLFSLAWATVVIAGFVRDVGLPYELVRDRHQRYGTVLLWELVTGAGITLLLIGGAPLLAGLDPDLPLVLRALALWVFLEALAVVPRVFFERQLEVNRLVGPELLRGFTFAALSIGLAAAGFGVWSFVAGELVAAAVFVVILWSRVRGQMPLRIEVAALPGLLRSSSWLFVIALVANVPPFVGRYFVEVFDSTAMVGQWEKAFTWGLRAQILVVPALVRVIYPALVTYRDDTDRFVGAFRLGTVAILSLEVVIAYFLYFNAEVVVLKILLGKNWEPAVELIRILCFLPLIDPFNRLGGEMLKAYRQDRLWLASVSLNLAALLVFGWLFARSMGAPGMAWAHYLVLGHFLMAWGVRRIVGMRRFWGLVGELAAIYLLPLPFFAATAWLFPQPGWGRFTASVVAAALVGGVMLWRFAAPFQRFFLQEVPAESPSDEPRGRA